MLADGGRYTPRFLVTAIGILSAPTMPNIPGVASFKGQSCHTHDWPKEGVDFAGKRVGIIGTGATAVQTIQEIAKTVGQLTVFQRNPNWCAPLHNGKISKAEMRDIRAHYQEIFALCRTTPGCYIHSPDPRTTLEMPPEERDAFWEKLYGSPGFGIWMGNFRDTLTDRAANALASEFIAHKIRQRVNDPVVAEKLIPKNHGFGTRRMPLETGYYEVYNQPNVELVDINETPIERMTPTGIQTSRQAYEFDIIIYATGFDAITGAFDRIDIRGVGGVRLKDVWANGPQTYLGVFVKGFPNMLMAMGPHAGLGNYTRTAEYSVEWVTGVIQYATRARADPDRSHCRRCPRMDRSRSGAGAGATHERDRLLDDGRQPQCRRQAKARIMRFAEAIQPIESIATPSQRRATASSRWLRQLSAFPLPIAANIRRLQRSRKTRTAGQALAEARGQRHAR